MKSNYNINRVNIKNCSCVIVTLNPCETLIDSLKVHLTLFKKVIIFDNNSHYSKFKLIESFSRDYDKIQILKSKLNRGIGYALNKGIEKLKDTNNWICLFDQDSTPPKNLFEAYNTVILSKNYDKEIGLIGIDFSKEPSYSSRFTAKKSLSIITSGSLINTNVFKTVGVFNEKFFIDSVDFEFNLRLAKFGFETLLIEQKLLKHKLGNEICKKFFGLIICSTNHNKDRRFYMSRNHLVLSIHYFKSFPFWILKKNVFYIDSLLKIILVEKDVVSKLICCFKGLYFGLKNYKKII